MPRPSRKAVLGDGDCCVHLTIRAHNRAFLFQDEEVKRLLYNLLLSLKLACGVLVFHYAFLDNHIHLLIFAGSTELLSRFMQKVFGSLARFVNKRFGRSGRVFGDRARTPVVQDGRRFLTVMRYLDLNPVRAGIVPKSYQYKWSSYRHYAFGEPDELIDDAPEYLGLSKVPAIRRKLYRELSSSVPQRGRRRLPEMTSFYFIGDKDWVVMMCLRRGFLSRKKKPPE